MFQASDEKFAVEMSPIEEADIKVDFEELSDANDDQVNYDGTRWIVICLSAVFMLHRFYCCFFNLFRDYNFIPVTLITL